MSDDPQASEFLNDQQRRSAGLLPKEKRRRGRSLKVPGHLLQQSVVIPDADRDRGIHLQAGSGSGKSIMTGGRICLQDFLRGQAQILWDPLGPLVDSFLLQVARLPAWYRARLWSRIRYVCMSGRLAGRVVRFPLLFELPGDTRRDVADRFLHALLKSDPALTGAPILGWNPLYRVGSHAGVLMASLGRPLIDALDLLRDPEGWEGRFAAAMNRYPEAAAAVAFFRNEYIPLKPSDRLALASSYITKLTPFAADDDLRAMFSSTEPGLDLEQVVAKRETVLLDFRREQNAERRAFKNRFTFEFVMAYVKSRGAGRHPLLGLVIDELTELTNTSAASQDLFAKELDELVNVIGRNYSVALLLAHQQGFQLPPSTLNSLLTMGTQIIGSVSDLETAKMYAEVFAPLDPHRVKRWQNVWGSNRGWDYVIEQIPVDMPLEEQILLASRVFMRLKPFQFLVRKKGSYDMRLVDAHPGATSPWPNQRRTALDYIQYQLALRSGVARAAPSDSTDGSVAFDTIEDDDPEVFYDRIPEDG